MPRRHTLPRRRRQAKGRNLAEWRTENPRVFSERCATTFPDGLACKGMAIKLGYCAKCWGENTSA